MNKILNPILNAIGLVFAIIIIPFNPLLGIALTALNGALLVYNSAKLQEHLEKK